MDESSQSDITQILHDWNSGDEGAHERLLPYVYDELKRQARRLMSRERVNHTLQPTALVHETFLRLVKQAGIDWQDRGHFYAVASRLMRQILVDHARKHAAAKRGSGAIHFSTEDLDLPVEERADSIIRLDEALSRLAKLDPKQVKVVEMRYFGGMTNAEIAEALDISVRTVVREWHSARLWLFRELNETG